MGRDPDPKIDLFPIFPNGKEMNKTQEARIIPLDTHTTTWQIGPHPKQILLLKNLCYFYS